MEVKVSAPVENISYIQPWYLTQCAELSKVKLCFDYLIMVYLK